MELLKRKIEARKRKTIGVWIVAIMCGRSKTVGRKEKEQKLTWRGRTPLNLTLRHRTINTLDRW